MNYRNIISFFVLFVSKETLSTESTHSLQQYNITKLLDEWFAKIFQVDLDMANEVRESFGSSEYYRQTDYEYPLDHDVKPFKNKFIFQDCTFYRHKEDNEETSRISQISFNFLENKINVTMKKLRITLEAELRTQYDTPFLTIFTTLNFCYFTLSATKSSRNDNRIVIDISYDSFFTLHYGLGEDIHWSGEQKLGIIEKDQLTVEIQPAIILMLRTHINQNYRFIRAFNTIFSNISVIKNDILSTNPDILDRKHKYYYYIPRVPFYRFSLNEIRIKRLSNIQSLDVYIKSYNFTHTLVAKDIRGSMILDYGSAPGAPRPLKMKFKADHLTISIQQEKNCGHVKAKYYSVNSTIGLLTHRQATTIMQKIESAIFSSIMPSIGVWNLCNEETPIDVQNISETCDWATIKKTYKDWIPFNGVLQKPIRSKIKI